MEKPTIFFSHSSIDKDYISYLHKKISQTTAKTVEVFQSSDGESIPFGNNWVHKIEENLHKAKVMFVFVSPTSIASSWIYFESGFAYAKGVKVIPIGIKGVDVGQLRPPLNLLQGFNITSENGMNNIITVLNREFGCEYNESYNCQDYLELSGFDENQAAMDSGVLSKINYINFGFPSSFGDMKKPDSFSLCSEPLKVISDRLDNLDIQSGFGNNGTLHSHGVLVNYNKSMNSSIQPLTIKIDPFILSTYDGFINAMCDDLYGVGKLKKFWCNIVLNKSVSLETTNFKVSSKLHKVGVELSDLNGSYFKYGDMDFTIEPQKDSRSVSGEVIEENLKVVFDSGQFKAKNIISLVSDLIDSKVIE